MKMKMNPTTPNHPSHDGHHGHAGHVTVAGTARHGDFLEIEVSSASPDGAEYDSDDQHGASALLKATKKAKTTTTTTTAVAAATAITKKQRHQHQHQHQHHCKIPGTRTILLCSLLLVTLTSLSTVVKEAWTWDPARICEQWSNACIFQDQRAATTTMETPSTQAIPRTEFFVVRQPRTVFFVGTPWMKEAARPTNHSHNHNHTSSSSSIRVHYPMKLLPPTGRNNDTNAHDDNDDDDDVTRFYPTVDSQDTSMERRIWPRHELDPHCEPMADWQTTFYPICNELHGTDMADSLVDDDLQLLSSKGFWRHAWEMDDEANQNITTVLKTFKLAHNMEEAFFENNRVDAVAMERLTASPGVVSIYALCGMSVVTEYAGKELADVARHLNASQRLDLAVQVAQGLSDVHSIGGNNDDGSGRGARPSLVHNDLNLANLVLTPDNRPVLNDFNIAILLMKHNETGETCPFASHFPNPQWRGPEEQVNSEYESDTHPPIVTEKIDIYALGNVFYKLAVGASPWKRPGAKKLSPEEKVEVARLKRTNGTLPAIPDDIINSADPAIQALLKAMYACYQFDPLKRPTAAQVVTMLSRSSASIHAGPDGRRRRRRRRRLSRNQTW